MSVAWKASDDVSKGPMAMTFARSRKAGTAVVRDISTVHDGTSKESSRTLSLYAHVVSSLKATGMTRGYPGPVPNETLNVPRTGVRWSATPVTMYSRMPTTLAKT